MADFFDQEAEVGTTDESDALGSDEEIHGSSKRKKKQKAQKKKKSSKQMVDSDDEDDDNEELDKDLEGLIDDNPLDDDDEEAGDENKEGSEESELDEELEEDELDLIEENLGIRIERKKKLKRVRTQISSDEEDEREGEEGDDRDMIAREIFDDDDEGPAPEARDEGELDESQAPSQEFGDLEEEEGEEESDVDDFIVDDADQPIRTAKKKKTFHTDSQHQEAQEIFGVDFDFEEFEQYDEDYEEDEEAEEDEYEDEEEEEVDGEAPPKPKKAAKQRKKPRGKSIYQIIEPSELERGFHTDLDQEIRTADMPERFQLRGIPVSPTEDGELDDEAKWIFRLAFMEGSVSQQDFNQPDGMGDQPFSEGRRQPHQPPLHRKEASTVGKIRKALNFMRNQQFEVPFIAFYRKEYVEPELNIGDLWKVYHYDEKWMQLRSRKQNLIRLFERMQTFQFDMIDPDQVLESHVRALTEEDINRVKNVQSMEELRDVYQHFMLYYGPELPKMKQALKAKKRQEREAAAAAQGEEPAEREDEDDGNAPKHGYRKTGYVLCIRAGLAELARKFGLSPEHFGENLRDNYQRNDIEQDSAHPQELANEFVCEQFSTPDDVLKGARHIVAMQIAHDPLVRECVRTAVQERAKLTVQATKKGLKEVDESHNCYTFKFLKNKPVRELSNDQFLKIVQAEEDGLLTVQLHIDIRDAGSNVQTYFEEIKGLYTLDEFSNLVQDWNNEREQALQRALDVVLYPQLLKDLKAKLVEEAKEHIVKSCSRRLYSYLKIAPYQVDQQLDDDDDDMDTNKGLKVMAVSFSTEMDEAQFCVMIDGDGEVTDYMRLTHLLKRRNSWRPDDATNKEKDLAKIKDFILRKKPHVIGIYAETREALMVQDDLKGVVTELEHEEQLMPINVELVDTELARIYANSRKAEQDFREYPAILRQAISIARRLQDPMVEFAQLCNADEDIMALRYHPLQDLISKEELLNALYLEFINRVNEVGVDVNACVTHSHRAPLVQFVCGLGPRKGYHLLKILRQKNQPLENRTQLVVMCRMGPKVFINCAGFIKIDTSALGHTGTDTYLEVLDFSRVHPETYEWARKMAVDALEYDDTAEDANPASALEEILESPERLKDLDLDAFAEELEKQGYGNRQITLYDIREELNHRYKDLRTPYRAPTAEERFNMVTKETPQTFYIGKMVMCCVTSIAHKRPHGDQLDQANPVRDNDTGLWQCPFCQKNDFPELSEVWNHFDAGECVGQAVGVKTRLDNGVAGFIPLKALSDSKVTDPEQRVKPRMTLHCRITKIDIERFQVELTSRSSDLADKDNQWKLQKDMYYDFEQEEKEVRREDEKKKQKARQTYVKRVIAHPSFHNVDYKTCEKLMISMEQGDVIIRPSSKGTDHLTCTWKVTDDILSHIDVREENKENAFSLGHSLWILNEEFEDLDEIIARHIQPMAAFARDILNYKYYRNMDSTKREVLEKLIIDEKKKAPSRIPYYFCASKQFPGKFMLSYLPRKSVRHEFVTITPDGFRYRQQVFSSLGSLVRWFKEHFRDPIPGTPAGMKTPKTPMGPGTMPTPNVNLQNVDAATIQRAAAGMSNTVYNTLAQVAGQTPFGNFNQFQTPMMTPMMTPAQQQQQGFVAPGQVNTPMANPMRTPTQGYQGGGGWNMGTPRHHPSQSPRHLPGQSPRHHPGQGSRQHSGSTPRNQGGITPRHQPGGGTPRHQPGGGTPHTMGSGTPRQHAFASPRHQPGGGNTPRNYGSSGGGRRTPRSGNTSSNKDSSFSGGGGQDWAKMAEQWAKQRREEGPGDLDSTASSGRSRRTPRSGHNTPRGDATPLFDER